MFRISNKLSTMISLSLSILLFCLLLVLTVWMPGVVDSMIEVGDRLGTRAQITPRERGLLLTLSYLMVAVAGGAILLLSLLLRTVLCDCVFSNSAVAFLRALSWCCFAEGGLFLWVGLYFQLAFGVCIVMLFVGLCLRVVKNVIAQATRIKSENDFTI